MSFVNNVLLPEYTGVLLNPGSPINKYIVAQAAPDWVGKTAVPKVTNTYGT
jgi:hypothetical protein